MSTFKKKYYYDFKSVDKKSHTVEIWQDISTGISSTKVIGATDPFVVTLSGIENKFQPVRGTGADLGLFATSSMQYMDLYTANMMEYQVRHYIDSQLNWSGFLDSELFTSDFSRQKNYSVNITANDGFGLLDRLYYVQSDGSQYTGISSHFDILKLILQKLGLPWTSLYVALSTSITGVTPASSETILHKTFAFNSNFYDEDGTAFTLREMLEAVLKPLGAFIQQSFGNLYITDINLVAGTEYIAKVYDGATFTYSSEVGLSKVIGDLSTIGFASNSQTLTIIPGVNKEVIAYSPYRMKELLEYSPSVKVNGVGDFSGYLSTDTWGSSSFNWTEAYYSTSDVWERVNTTRGHFVFMKGIDSPNNGISDTYFKDWSNSVSCDYALHSSFTTGYHTFHLKAGDLNVYASDASYGLKIEMKAFPRYKNDLANGNEVQNVILSDMIIHCDVSIGGKHYKYVDYGSDNGWKPASDTGFASFRFYQRTAVDTYSNITDTWVELLNYQSAWDGDSFSSYESKPVILPLDVSVGGPFTFNIYGYSCFLKRAGQTVWDYIYCSDIRIKDIKFTVVDSDGNDVQEVDIEYVGYMNPQYVNEGKKIELIQGTNLSNYPRERGGLLKYDASGYSWIKQWTRGSATDNIENLLLRSFVGNYETQSIELAAKTKLITNTIGYLTYSSPLSGKKFMVTSATHDYANNTSDLTMQEIFVDSLTINKSF